MEYIIPVEDYTLASYMIFLINVLILIVNCWLTSLFASKEKIKKKEKRE